MLTQLEINYSIKIIYYIHAITYSKFSCPEGVQKISRLLLCFVFPSSPLSDDNTSFLFQQNCCWSQYWFRLKFCVVRTSKHNLG